MKHAIISSVTLFNSALNPGCRIDAAMGISLAALEQGNLDLLRSMFKHLFRSEAKGREWEANFKKVQTRQEAFDLVLEAFGVKTTGNGPDGIKVLARLIALPPQFTEGLNRLVDRLLTERVEKLKEEEVQIMNDIIRLQGMITPRLEP
jgi:hypothetical protein